MQNRCRSNLNFVKKKIIPSGLKQSSGSKNHFLPIHNPYNKKKNRYNKNKLTYITRCMTNK